MEATISGETGTTVAERTAATGTAAAGMALVTSQPAAEFRWQRKLVQ